MDTADVRNKTYDMVTIALFAVLIAVCSWISIPTAIPFSLQTFAVFLALGVLGGKKGLLAVFIYILLGAAGVPVFAGFTSGIGILFGNTGGYFFGFLFSALLYWGIETVLGCKTWVAALSMVLGLVLCYAFGTVWFLIIYAKSIGPVGPATVLGWCVVPFIIPDLIKIFLALLLRRRLLHIMRLPSSL